jgi:V/A-type H+/Na+-transporting ATPase subunit C
MDNTIFAQSIARIRFLETKLIEKSKLEGLVEAKDFEDALKMLQDSRYSEYVEMASYEEGLKIALEDLYKDMYKTTPVKEVLDILAIRYDAHNIKSLIKGKFLDKDMTSILINAGTIPEDKLSIMIKEENFRDVPKTLRASIEKSLEDYKNAQDPQNIDITIDKGIYAYALEIAKESKIGYLEEIVKLMIDIVNLKSFVRIKLQDKEKDFLQRVFIHGGHIDIDKFVNNFNDSLESFANKIMHTDHFKWVGEGISDYIKNGDLGGIERNGDNFILNYLKKAKLVSFGPEPIVAYVIARENEIKALRIILTGKKNEVQPDIIRERLRDVYV